MFIAVGFLIDMYIGAKTSVLQGAPEELNKHLNMLNLLKVVLVILLIAS